MAAPSLGALFTEHPRSVGETYPEHARQATRFALRLLGSGLACLVHALVPALCRTTGSDAIERLHRDMVTARRDRTGPTASPKPRPRATTRAPSPRANA